MSEKIARKIARALKPPRCPRCGKELTYLINVCEEFHVYYFEVDEEGEVDYRDKDSWPGDTSEYGCPFCFEVLFTSEEEAKAFLLGEDLGED